MKRAFSLVVLILVTVSLFASIQKYFPVSSSEWKRVNEICHLAGVAGPTSAGPVTIAQLEVALARAEKRLGEENPLIKEAKEALGLEEILFSDDLGSFSYLGTIKPQVYLQTNGGNMAVDSKNPDSDWFVADSKDRAHVLDFLMEFNLKENLYARFVMPMAQKQAPKASGVQYWDDGFHQNLYGVRKAQNFPYDAGVSLGSDNLSLIIARGRLSLGEGYTGNTAIGDNYDYQEFLKAGFWSRHYGIYLSLTNFDSSHDTSFGDDMYAVQCSRFSDYKQIRHAVTYEVVPVDNVKASLTLINLLDSTSAFDFRMLNPMFIFHNMYNYHEEEKSLLESNNMISLDVSWSPTRKWNLYGQFSMDQIQVGGETDYYMSHIGYVDPNAFGGLVNLSYTDEVEDGLLEAYIEVAANSPAMYLNQKYYTDASGTVGQKSTNPGNIGYCWSQDWLLGYRRTEEKADDMAFSGYSYGPDCIAVGLGASYEKLGKYTVEGRAFYLAHGEKGTGTDPDNYTFAGVSTPETVNKLPLVGETVEHTLALSAEGTYWVKSWLGLYGGAAYSHQWNYRNVEGETFGNLQLALGLTISSKD